MGVRPVCLYTVGPSFFKGESCYELKFTLWTSSSSKRLRKLLSLPTLEASSSIDASELSRLKRTALIGVLTPKLMLSLMVALASLNSVLGL